MFLTLFVWQAVMRRIFSTIRNCECLLGDYFFYSHNLYRLITQLYFMKKIGTDPS